jgi:hypothetical protein
MPPMTSAAANVTIRIGPFDVSVATTGECVPCSSLLRCG